MKQIDPIYIELMDKVSHYVRGYGDGIYHYYNQANGGIWYQMGHDDCNRQLACDIVKPIKHESMETSNQVLRMFNICYPNWHKF